MRWILVYIAGFTLITAQANDTLYIVKGQVLLGNNSTYMCVFNDSSNFFPRNATLYLPSSPSYNLTVINLDTSIHTFTIDGHITSGNTITPQDTATFLLSGLADGTYRYYSNVPSGKLIGASGTIIVGYNQYTRFAWNLLDVDTNSFTNIATGASSAHTSSYIASYFLINGMMHPQTLSDRETAIEGDLGDTLIICVVNSGQMINSFHFHGFHVTILDAKKSTDYIGWTKDSMPFLRGEAMTLMLVANQVGIYPVHSHNLMAVTNSGLYPGGMLTQITIDP